MVDTRTPLSVTHVSILTQSSDLMLDFAYDLIASNDFAEVRLLQLLGDMVFELSCVSRFFFTLSAELLVASFPHTVSGSHVGHVSFDKPSSVVIRT